MAPNNSKKADKAKAKKNDAKGKKIVKKPVRKTPTLKRQLQKASKVVRADSLNWTKVEIPDNIDDFLGCYGLEEIDGVDVKIVNGKTEFIVKEDRKLAKDGEEEEEEDDEEDEEDDGMEQVEEEDAEDTGKEGGSEIEEEFTGFDDEEIKEEPQPKVQDKKQDKQKNKKQEKKKQEVVEDSDTEISDNEDEELTNAFQYLDLPLPDEAEIDLPDWNNEEEGLSLSPYILSGFSALEFASPTPIQQKTIPLAIKGKDVIGKATTGSGKTLAYGIPILQRYIANLNTIKQSKKDKTIPPPTGIIFAPTRELAHQVVSHMNQLAKYTPLSQHGIVSITGGLSIQKQERLLSHGPGIIVATPGRCLELMEKDPELAIRLASTDMIVLDEADRLLQDGHFEEFEKILELFGKTRPKNELKEWKWQTLVFSATFARELFGKLDKFQKKKPTEGGLIENDEILELLNSKLKFKDSKPALIDANPKEIVSGMVTEALVECGPTERDLYLYYFLLMYPGTTLIFANAIDSVKRLVPFLSNLGIPAFSIHSSMIQKQRLRALERFKAASQKNEIAVLLASDVAARGLDIPDIDHVAHYHLPRTADVYIHRSGRTARAGKEGVSVMFCSPQESSGPLRKLRKLVAENAKTGSKLNMHNNVKLLPIEMDLITQLKPRVSLAAKLADATISSTSTMKEDNWVKVAAEELGVEDLEDINDFEDDFIKRTRKRKEGKQLTKQEARDMRNELNHMLSDQIRTNNRRSYLTSGLQNLAHQMVSGKSHKEVLGHEKVNALDDLKSKKTENKKLKKKAGKVNKPKNERRERKDNKKEMKARAEKKQKKET